MTDWGTGKPSPLPQLRINTVALTRDSHSDFSDPRPLLPSFSDHDPKVRFLRDQAHHPMTRASHSGSSVSRTLGHAPSNQASFLGPRMTRNLDLSFND